MLTKSLNTVQIERVRIWLDALRSGKFKQADGVLRTKDFYAEEPGYCCLGVACEVYNKHAAAEPIQLPLTGDAKEILPWQVAEWFGFDERDPLVKIEFDDHGNYKWSSATELNDEKHMTFEEIAAAFGRTYYVE